MRVTLLGTGTSTGVPQVGCGCEVCRSTDPRARRLRSAALLDTDDGRRLLFDCGPDFRAQMLSVDFRRLDAVFITHEHYDHVGGLDDLRPFCVYGDVDVYAQDDCADDLQTRLPYCFAEHPYPGVPRISLRRIRPGEVVHVGEVEVRPFRVMTAAYSWLPCRPFCLCDGHDSHCSGQPSRFGGARLPCRQCTSL